MHEPREDRQRFAGESHRSGSLARLKELDDYKVADHDEDIRGWEVCTPDGRKVGEIEELIVDTSVMKARYMEVKVEKEITRTDEDRWALVPVGTARLNEDRKEVVIDHFPTGALLSDEDRKRQGLDREVELSLREQYGATSTGLAADTGLANDDDFYAGTLYDDTRLRRKQRSDPYITRHSGDADRRI